MAEFSAPSFSLGLDLDFDPPSGGAVREDVRLERSRPDPAGGGARVSVTDVRMREVEKEEDEDDAGFDLPRPPDPVPVFKRLKKGPPSTRRSPPPAVAMTRGSRTEKDDGRGFNPFELPNADDDIEEFSSQEDCRLLDSVLSRKNPSTCSSSKISLHGCKILTSQSSSKAEAINKNTLSNAPLTQNLEASSSKKMLPKLTVSPLRKIQFLDSDSDIDASLFHDDSGAKRADSSCKVGSSSRSHPAMVQEKVKNAKLDKTPSECLWKDNLTTNNANLATPALDDFCKEYFSTSRNKKTGQASSGVCFPDDCSENYQYQKASTSKEPYWNLPDPQPPAYRYFFHSDSRIRELVRLRLCNFVPLGSPLHQGNHQCDADSLDYMCQFGPKAAPVQINEGARKTPAKTSGKRKIKTNGNAGEPSSSGNWVNPRNSMNYPKDAGKRRVCGDRHTSGHWYTGQDGRKVYVTKNGQELSGSAAYRYYRKETGAGFRKTKKKAVAKKTKTKR